MQKIFLKVLLLVVSAAFFGHAALAQAQEQGPKLSLKMTAEKEVKTVKGGKEVVERVPADKLKAGEVVSYTITYTNDGNSDAVNAVIEDPVPRSVVYIPGSAEGKGAEITFSIDGGRSYHKAPVKQSVKVNGRQEERDAPAESYTNIRWTVKKVAPGLSGNVNFKAKVK